MYTVLTLPVAGSTGFVVVVAVVVVVSRTLQKWRTIYK